MNHHPHHTPFYTLMHTLRLCVVCISVVCSLRATGHAVQAEDTPPNTVHVLDIQGVLDRYPGKLKTYQENDHSAATIIESHSLYYGVSPYLHVLLLETVNGLLSNPNPSDNLLRHPYSPDAPDGFSAQIEWASQQLRAGFGPYEHAPVLHFDDGVNITLTLDQAPEGVALQRFLANVASTSTEWKQLNQRFAQFFETAFNSELPQITQLAPDSSAPTLTSSAGFLHCPWPVGMPMVHLAYFDHAYPTVDSGADGNNVVVTYVGIAAVQYNSHDGHDYFFPDVPVGTPILAAAAGVAYARTARGNGVVIIHPDGYETVYWHLNYFAPKLRPIVDSPRGMWVEQGEVIGTSGTSGFSYGTPHLHFEVRHYGRQVDPYGWYGEGADPCEDYAGCVNQGWLWDSELLGIYDFTPPDYQNNGADATDGTVAAPGSGFIPDRTPPIGTLSINPPDDLQLLVHFDGHVVQQVGTGQPSQQGTLSFTDGQFDRALALPDGSSISYPLDGNIHPEQGTISLWVRIPDTFPPSPIERHYVFAASASPDNDDYLGTFALRRDVMGADNAPQWDVWTTPNDDSTARHDLIVPDTFTPGWHHVAVTWDAEHGSKQLYMDGNLAAAADHVQLPTNIGNALRLGQFAADGQQSGLQFDELATFNRALSDDEIAALAAATAPVQASTTQIHDTHITLDTNAMDSEGIIVAVQIGQNTLFHDPQPYYDGFQWDLPPHEGDYDIEVRYFDKASNRRVISQTVTLNREPTGMVRMLANDGIAATLVLTATDKHMPLEMQMSESAMFDDATWEPFRPQTRWIWRTDGVRSTNEPPTIVTRFRDSTGLVSQPVVITAAESLSLQQRVYIPMALSQHTTHAAP